MNRRKFIHTVTAGLGTLAAVESIAKDHSISFNKTDAGSLKILATNWGFKGDVNAFCTAAKKEGYDGSEFWWPQTPKDRDLLFTALKKHGLEVGFLCGSGLTDYSAHLDFFKKSIDAAVKSEIKPLYINCHSGRDHFSYDQNKAFIDYTNEASEKSGIPIYHETHRGRMLFAAHVTRNFIEKNPKLRLTLDISHWCNVHESLLEDQEETVQLALSRVGHIHARIGHAEGPQVNDPRAPEWESAVKAHLAWWDRVVERKIKNGEPITFLTEFGPPGYLPTVPFTNQPLADQWGINVFMMQLLRKRYSK